jgi:hypothetical protein
MYFVLPTKLCLSCGRAASMGCGLSTEDAASLGVDLMVPDFSIHFSGQEVRPGAPATQVEEKMFRLQLELCKTRVSLQSAKPPKPRCDYPPIFLGDIANLCPLSPRLRYEVLGAVPSVWQAAGSAARSVWSRLVMGLFRRADFRGQDQGSGTLMQTALAPWRRKISWRNAVGLGTVS